MLIKREYRDTHIDQKIKQSKRILIIEHRFGTNSKYQKLIYSMCTSLKQRIVLFFELITRKEPSDISNLHAHSKKYAQGTFFLN